MPLKEHDVTENTQRTVARKSEHLKINLENDVRSGGMPAGFERYQFEHSACPEIDLDEVDTSTVVFGRNLNAPILISSMTGGTPEAGRVNKTLARVAQHERIAIGLGSGRVLIEDPSLLESFAVRREAPDALLCANLGAVQLNYGVENSACQWLVDALQADALVLHLNPLQEALQEGGNTRFRGILSKIEDLCRVLNVPVIVKEVGWGISANVARMLIEVGVRGIDVGGAGGTSWSEIERLGAGDKRTARIAATFRTWGIPTVESLLAVRSLPEVPTIIASGGVRNGIDVAKSIALGADLAGLAGPFLRAAALGDDHALEFCKQLVQELRITMFATGVANISGLRRLQLESSRS